MTRSGFPVWVTMILATCSLLSIFDLTIPAGQA